MLFQGREAAPIISQTRPAIPTKPTPTPNAPAGGFPIVILELEDADLLNIITGGLPGLKALSTQRLRVLGDLRLAQQLEAAFVGAGGAEQVAVFLESIKQQRRSKL